MISLHLCQGATCPGLKAASGIYFCSFSVFFPHLSLTGPGRLFYFSRRLTRSVGLWSEQEKGYLKAEDVQPCGIGGGGGAPGSGGKGAELEVEQFLGLRERLRLALKPDCALQCQMSPTLFKLNGSQGTQTEAILVLDMKLELPCVLQEREVNAV